MWTQVVKRDDGVLRLPAQSFELGGVLVDRADAFLAAHPNSRDELRRIFTLKLATVREDGEPTRRRAARSEFTDEEWRLGSEPPDHPNRLRVTGTPEGGETYLRLRIATLAEVLWPKVLTAEAEHALEPGQGFKECAYCPEMVVVPAGSFTMGSPANEKDRRSNENPQHKVTIAKPFAVSKFEVTFDEWDACVILGGCVYQASDQGCGRGTGPGT